MSNKKNLEGLRYQANQHEDNGKFPQAEALRKQILELLSDDKSSIEYRQASIDYAANLFGQGRYVTAVTTAEEALTIAASDITLAVEQDIQILWLLAQAYERLDQAWNAKVRLEQLLWVKSSGLVNGPLSSQHLVLESLAKLSLKTNDLDAAEKYITRLVDDLQTCLESLGSERLAILVEELVKRLINDEQYVAARFWSHKEIRLRKRYMYKANDYQRSHSYGRALHRLAAICKILGKVSTAKVFYRAHLKVVGPHLGNQYCELSDSIANLFELSPHIQIE